MTRKTLILFAALALSILASGQQQYMADKVVAVVGARPILYSDVVRQAQMITEQNRANSYTSPRDPMVEALEMLLEQKLLFQRAQIDSIGIEALAPNIAEAVDSNVEAMVAEAGSIRELETEKGKPMYTIKDDLRNELEEYYGANQMRDWIIAPERVKVTPGEVDRFYRRIDPDSLPIIPEQYVYAQITKLPASAELAKQRTVERLLELRQRIIDGDRFDRLAISFSVDPGTMASGGDLGVAPKEQWHGSFGEAMSKLQPGQVSGVVETPDGFHIIQLIDKQGDNLYHARHILMKPTYTDEDLQEAVSFLDSLAGVIRTGDITFDDAAVRYSDDKASRMNGGIVSNQQMLFLYTQNSDPKSTRTSFVRDALDPTDASHLIRLREGEMSTPFVGRDLKMEEMGKLLKLVKIIPAHKANLEEDWLDVEMMALANKQQAHYKEWLDGKIDEMYVRIDPMFSADNFLNKKWFK
jgi:peptidyl-prolyl cis-trans isomerase SurA